ncbi:TetR family transcriptional regulator [Oenococcus kitaharae]|uniref:TetR/AcrR family transcriptional regulator n=1 Tax=Oenococcus kitaharae TaxID=336988 RepID=UPI0008630FDB|nr:TetR/AcrR family transcriptional regulator [Oenococcus kitaharae]OEY82556.1 TetR family transcriptional regulator [Oenococcus kitaharae]
MNKKKAILQAALKLFAEKSFYGTKMPEISQLANVGAGTIYRYFDSKEDLVNNLFLRTMTQFDQQLELNFPNTMATKIQFHHLFQSLWSYVVNNTQAFIFINLHDQGKYLDSQSRASFDKLWDFITEIISHGQTRGDLIDLDPKSIVSLVYGPLIPISKMLSHQGYTASKDLVFALEEATWRAVSIT